MDGRETHRQVKSFAKGLAIAAVVGLVVVALFQMLGGAVKGSNTFDETMNTAVDRFEDKNFAAAAADFRKARDLAILRLRKATDKEERAKIKQEEADARYHLGVTLTRQLEIKYRDQLAAAMLDPEDAFAIPAADARPAFQELKQAAALNPDSAHVQHALGYLESLSGNPVAAIQYLQKAVELDPYFAEAYNDLGLQHLNLRRFKEALTNFETADRIARGNLASARYNLGMYFANVNQGRPNKEERAKALEYLRDFLNHESDTPSAVVAKRQVERLAGKP